jgi:hypothetical protein
VVNQLHIQGDKPTLRALGLAILASVFHRDLGRISVHPRNPRSTLERLVIDSKWEPPLDDPGYVAVPHCLNFYPAEVSKHPWSYDGRNPKDLPIVQLTTEKEFLDSAGDLESRSVAVGFGRASGAALFAELLLNASRETCVEDEFELEGEMGFRGVGPGSVEIRVWLPGSVGYTAAPSNRPKGHRARPYA